MKIPPTICHILLLILCSGVGLAQADERLPKPFFALYKAKYSGISITAERSLSVNKQQQLRLHFKARSWVATIDEQSDFVWGDHGFLIPQEYSYNRKGLGRNRHAHLSFDWDKREVTNRVQDSNWTMALPEVALDKLGYQLQLRKDLLNGRDLREYQIADGGRIKRYNFAVEGREQLQTPLGTLNTVQIKRIRKDTKRTTNIWLAEDWDYLIVKLQHTESNGKAYEINLAEATVDQQPVTGIYLPSPTEEPL